MPTHPVDLQPGEPPRAADDEAPAGEPPAEVRSPAPRAEAAGADDLAPAGTRATPGRAGADAADADPGDRPDPPAARVPPDAPEPHGAPEPPDAGGPAGAAPGDDAARAAPGGDPGDDGHDSGASEAADADEASPQPSPTPAPSGRRTWRRRGKRDRAPGRDPLWARLLVVVGALLVLASSGSITASKVLAHRYDRSVHKSNLLAPGARQGDRHTTVTGPLNFLLIGSDARDTDESAGQRSDTIIILHVPASLDRAYLISIPRDLRVDIPPFPPTGFAGTRGEKINGAFEYGQGGRGGAQLLSATLNQLIGVAFDGAAIIDFDGFKKAVGVLGGVDMCVDERTESHHLGFDKNGNFLPPWTGPDGDIRVPGSTPVVYEVGCRHMEPWQALDYVRQRKSLPDGDYGRQRHQQQFLRAIMDTARRQGLATNPVRLDALIRAIGSSLTVDANGVPLTELAYALRGIQPDAVVGVKVPSYPENVGRYAYVLPYEDQAQSLYAAIRSDSLDAWVVANPLWVNAL